MGKPIKAPWDRIRDAAIAGVPLPKLSETYKVPLLALQKRAYRGAWLTPQKVKGLQKVHEKALSASRPEGPESREIVTSLMNAQVDNLATVLVDKITRATTKAVEDTNIVTPSDLTEVSKAVGILWKLTGRDKPQPVQVHLGVWHGGDAKVSVNDLCDGDCVSAEADSSALCDEDMAGEG